MRKFARDSVLPEKINFTKRRDASRAVRFFCSTCSGTTHAQYLNTDQFQGLGTGRAGCRQAARNTTAPRVAGDANVLSCATPACASSERHLAVFVLTYRWSATVPITGAEAIRADVREAARNPCQLAVIGC